MAWMGMFGEPGRLRKDLEHFVGFRFSFRAVLLWLGLPKNAGRHVASATDGDHQIRLEVIENLRSGELA